MNDANMISIIVPVYKVEAYLERCVDSILAQKPQDFEVILVDDGSPDSCGAICDRYAAQDDRVIVIHQQNGGLSAARNAGLRMARGNYVLFVDSDDYLSPGALSVVSKHLSDGIDVLTFGFAEEDENGSPICISPRTPCRAFMPDVDARVLGLYREYLTGGWSYCVWCRVYRRAVIEKHGIRFVDTRKICAEDVHFNVCFFLVARTHKVIGDVLYHYMHRDSGLYLSSVSVNQTHKMISLCDEVRVFVESLQPGLRPTMLMPLIMAGILFVKMGFRAYDDGEMRQLEPEVRMKAEAILRTAYWNRALAARLTIREWLALNHHIGMLLGSARRGSVVERLGMAILGSLRK